MTPGQAERLYDSWEELLCAAENAIDCARRNVGRRNGFYSTEPQLHEARHQLEKALELLPQVEQAKRGARVRRLDAADVPRQTETLW